MSHTWWWARLPRVAERAVLVISALALIVNLIVAAEPGVVGTARLGAALTVLMAAAAFVVGRRRRYAGLALMTFAPLAAALLGWDPIATWSVACFAALWFTLRGAPGLATAALLGAGNLAAATIDAGTVVPSVDPAPSIAAGVAVLMAAAGSAVRSQQQYALSLAERANEAEATQQAVVDRSVAEERLRIARDLHDSVGHRVAVLSMHLGAAEVRLPPEAEPVRTDLAMLRDDVQAILRETQQILAVLRVARTEDSGAPTPGVERLPDLLASYRDAGLTIESTEPQRPPHLTRTASAASFRIVQEALTNVQKHGTGSASLMLSTRDDGGLTIEVTNLRRTSTTDQPGGHGLVGMRERAESAGGHLATGADGRVFWIRAELPGSGETP